MVHTFEKVRTRTPADPNDAAPEAIMPQAAWEALLREGEGEGHGQGEGKGRQGTLRQGGTEGPQVRGRTPIGTGH